MMGWWRNWHFYVCFLAQILCFVPCELSPCVFWADTREQSPAKWFVLLDYITTTSLIEMWGISYDRPTKIYCINVKFANVTSDCFLFTNSFHLATFNKAQFSVVHNSQMSCEILFCLGSLLPPQSYHVLAASMMSGCLVCFLLFMKLPGH